jgi:Protein of unknown function (DUF3592)
MIQPTSSGSPHRGLTARLPTGRGVGLVSLCMFIVGLVVSGWGLFELKQARESSGWPSTPGTITRSAIHQVANNKENQPETTYYPHIQYRYAVFGKGYTADRIAFGSPSGGDQGQAQKIVDRYFTGKTVTVYYDPDDPSVAVLNAGDRLQAHVMIAAGVMFAAGGIFFFKVWRRSRDRRNGYSGE